MKLQKKQNDSGGEGWVQWNLLNVFFNTFEYERLCQDNEPLDNEP